MIPVQIDEANLPGSPEEASWATEAINILLDSVRSIADAKMRSLVAGRDLFEGRE